MPESDGMTDCFPQSMQRRVKLGRNLYSAVQSHREVTDLSTRRIFSLNASVAQSNALCPNRPP